MKPAAFEYFAPRSIDEALSHLAEYGYDAKVLAGGQSLIPMMNFRLAQPAVIVDINRIAELSNIHAGNNGELHIGAMTRHSQVERDKAIAEQAPLIYETMPHIATVQIRNRGTFGGSLAHADPAAELTAVSVALDGYFLLRSLRGERWVAARDFFLGLFTSALEPDELLVDTKFPSLPERTGCAMLEVARRSHDFALAGVTAVVTLSKDGMCQNARLVLFSVGDGPVEATQAEEMLKDNALTPDLIRAAAETAAQKDIDPASDIHASIAYRRHLAGVLSRRALEKAYARAQGEK